MLASKRLFAVATALVCLAVCRPAAAQLIQRQVAGVWIDAHGIARNMEPAELEALRKAMQASLIPAAGEMAEFAPLRKVSLRRLEAAIQESVRTGKPIADEMKYLAGLQRIQYILVYPEQRDIVIVGPAEGWRIDEHGEVVGLTSGRPVLLLDDLLTALRSAEGARQTGISCSIDPTSEGITRLRELVKNLPVGGAIQPITSAIVETLGPQNITVTGVPGDSHFARVIVAADYRMKRLAMNFEEAPVRGMPSYLDMMHTGSSGMKNMLPRWWLAPDFGALLADASGLAWEIRKAGVKTMAEEDFVLANGDRRPSGKAGRLAKKWADNMTAHYEELSRKDPVFGQLRNCMDLAVLGALIVQQNLPERCGHSFPLLLNSKTLPVEQFNVPKQVDSQASVLKKGSNWLISASGGVEINSWLLIHQPESTAQLAPLRTKAASASDAWWWN